MWYEKSYRRNLVDMHIEEWNPEFLSKFSPEEYVNNLKRANIQSCMIYANSHVGLCYWPTKIGKPHPKMGGQDWFGTTVKLAKEAGMDVIAYYTIDFVNHEYETYPEWRMKDANGRGSREEGAVSSMGPRYGLVCPNNPDYRDYMDKHVGELIENYDLDGIFFDMNFWPLVCFCDSCRARYKKETGKDIPTTVDWRDPEWLQFQKQREYWLEDNAEFMWNIVKSRKPDMTIEQNFALAASNRFMSWQDGLAKWVDFNSGDFYGDVYAQSFFNKMHNTVTKNLPYEFMTSRTYPGLFNHTSVKPKDLLRMENAIALANGGAFFFIDAINPDGSMCREPYEMLGEIFRSTQKYEPYLGGRLSADVAVYSSYNCNCNMKAPVYSIAEKIEAQSHMAASMAMPEHTAGALSAARILQENHIPYTVVTKNSLKDLSKYAILVLSNIGIIDEEEAENIKAWVKEGGKLYMTGTEPLPFVEEIMDLKFGAMTESSTTYVYAADRDGFFTENIINPNDPVAALGAQREITVKGDAQVLAYIGLPYILPDQREFASIHSNPPGIRTEIPSVLLGRYGKGRIVWSSVAFEAAPAQYVALNQIFVNLIRKLMDRPWQFESSGAFCVDVTLIDQKEDSRWLMSFVNIQSSVNLLPVYDFKVALYTAGRKVKEVCLLPDEKTLEYTERDGYIEFTIDKLEVYEAVIVKYEE